MSSTAVMIGALRVKGNTCNLLPEGRGLFLLRVAPYDNGTQTQGK